MLRLFSSTLKNPDSTKNTNVFWAAIQHSSYFFLGFQWIIFSPKNESILSPYMENPHPSSSPKFFLLTFSAEPRLAKFTIFVHHQVLHKIIHPTFSFHRHPRTPNPDQDQRLLAGWWWQWSWLRAAFWGWGVFLKKYQVLEDLFQKHQVFGSSLGWGEMFGRHTYSQLCFWYLSTAIHDTTKRMVRCVLLGFATFNFDFLMNPWNLRTTWHLKRMKQNQKKTPFSETLPFPKTSWQF